mmetsp:Transcript_3834/g.4440  ORF Transcript_3834/g.4440 Transcript_3834/m.4440 type:complete len:80 (+) Transcript_3834:1746-1985(+)
MKPIFIHKYTKEKEKKADNFANEFVQSGKKIESEYGRSITSVGGYNRGRGGAARSVGFRHSMTSGVAAQRRSGSMAGSD